MAAPKYATSYIIYRNLLSVATPGTFQINPTIASGDFQVSKDGGTFANMTNLPAVTPSGSRQVKFIFTATEMTAGVLTLQGIDLAGNEWGDYSESFDIPTQSIEDIPTAIIISDTLLTRDWTSIVLTVPSYCVLNALRFLRNIWQVVAGTPPVLHVKAENGSTDAWTRNVTVDPAASPITGVT